MNRTLLALITALGAVSLAQAQIDPYKPVDKTLTTRLTPGEARGFVPQPEPPGDKLRKAQLKPGETQGVVPQPVPSGKPAK